jgi:FtsP/CotA-like multicopper oxidase with cupredoxin domain
VRNNFRDHRTSLHLHGIRQLNNPWMDGAVGITEAGIPPGLSFTYETTIIQTGTFWYHSHAGVQVRVIRAVQTGKSFTSDMDMGAPSQYADGLVGAVILNYANDTLDPVRAAFPYTAEYPLLLQDWFHEPSSDLLLRYAGPYGAFQGYQPECACSRLRFHLLSAH